MSNVQSPMVRFRNRFASEVEIQVVTYFVLFVCFVEFVDSFLGSKRTIHELHETHEVTRSCLRC